MTYRDTWKYEGINSASFGCSAVLPVLAQLAKKELIVGAAQNAGLGGGCEEYKGMLRNHLYVVVYGDAFGATEAGRYPGEGLAESSKIGEGKWLAKGT